MRVYYVYKELNGYGKRTVYSFRNGNPSTGEISPDFKSLTSMARALSPLEDDVSIRTIGGPRMEDEEGREIRIKRKEVRTYVRSGKTVEVSLTQKEMRILRRNCRFESPKRDTRYGLGH